MRLIDVEEGALLMTQERLRGGESFEDCSNAVFRYIQANVPYLSGEDCLRVSRNIVSQVEGELCSMDTEHDKLPQD